MKALHIPSISLDWLYWDFGTVWWLIEVALPPGSMKPYVFIPKEYYVLEM
jgi:hypothetical protein